MQLTLRHMWHGKGELSVLCNSGTHQLIAGLWGRRNESDRLTTVNNANKKHHLRCARDCTLCLPFYFTESSQSLNEVDAIIWLPPLPSENCGTEKLSRPSSHSWRVTRLGFKTAIFISESESWFLQILPLEWKNYLWLQAFEGLNLGRRAGPERSFYQDSRIDLSPSEFLGLHRKPRKEEQRLSVRGSCPRENSGCEVV